MANILFVLAFTCFSISECFSFERQVHPGIRFRVTNKGLQYADDVGMKVLFDKLREDNFKDISGKSGNLKYTISNVKNNDASINSSSFTVSPGKGLILRTTGINLDFSGDLRYKWFVVRDSIGFNFKVHGMSFNLSVRIGVDSGGRPTISAQKQDCSSDVDSVKVAFDGNTGWLYNLFSHQIDENVKDVLKELICEEARKAINDDGAKFLETFPVHKNVSSVALIDYSIIKNPTFFSNYMDVPMKGEFKQVGNPRATAPLVPATLPVSDEADKMVYIWLTDYVFNTASFVYHVKGALRTNIGPKGPIGKNLLNTETFQNFLHQLYEKYPNRPMFIKVYTTKPPVFTSSDKGTNVTVNGNVELYVTAKNGAHIYALTLGLRAVLAGTLGVKSGNITFHTKSFKTDARLVRSAIGNIRYSVELLQRYLNRFIKYGHFVEQLNEVGDRGFPLPMLRHIVWKDTELTTGEGFTLIKTNLKYRSKR